MSHTGTVKRAFLNKHVQSCLKSARALVVETWRCLFQFVVYSSYGGGMPEISETHPAIAHRVNTVTILFYSTLFGTVTVQNRGLKLALIDTRVATVDYSGILHKSHTFRVIIKRSNQCSFENLLLFKFSLLCARIQRTHHKWCIYKAGFYFTINQHFFTWRT
jgi:hypothetical protein